MGRRLVEMEIYEQQTIKLTLAAALEAIHRVLSDEDELDGYSSVDLSRKILKSLGFKYAE